MRFTDKSIKALKARAARYEVFEDGRPGFGLRVSPKGRKTWIYLYRFEGRSRRMTLGTYPQVGLARAHALHGDAEELIENGIDPGAKLVESRRETREAPTVAELADDYLERWARARKRSWREDARILEHDVLPVWRRRKAREIARRDVLHLLDSIVARGAPVQANRTFACVRRMFAFAVEKDIIATSPCAHVKAPAPERRRDRVLTEEEIRALWAALDRAATARELAAAGEEAEPNEPAHPRISLAVRQAIRFQLLTAQRKGEVVAAEWSEIDLDGGWWTIPSEKAKNALAHRVPLTAMARDVLAALRALDSPFVFPGRRRDRHLTPAALDHAIRKNEAAIGVAGVVPHDLRRTAASWMASAGVPRLVIAKVLNHADTGITAVYDRHGYDAEKRQALETWERKLGAILTERTAPVVSLLHG